ncbi:F-box protein SKIP8 [Vitis vinifera]|uniref:F-box protein SKIP8 n=1 Tax=Vitis vinifera TaxID=29760 RepID=A0A438J512_VITVI|nr:F-box protein SKIP8 [Vitis vinifera]
MEIASSFAGDFSFLQFLVALVVSGLCLVCALFAVRFSPASFGRKSRSVESDGGGSGGSLRKACSCSCLCRSVESGPATATAAAAAYLNGGAEEMLDRALVVSERQTGASMMEQLVPEITTHALSYLDYPSLCRLSMTNSLMRKAANDDNAWKALYHKDFTLEQDSVTPTNGWKAYYAATRAIVNINAEFFNIIRERSITSMSRLWFNADYVKCVHASGELFTGYNTFILLI